MKIGIIGVGYIGKTLVRKLSAAGHTVLMANSRGPESLKELAEETGASAVTAEEAVEDVDVAILSIPLNKLPLMNGILANAPTDVVVADTSNYYPHRDGHIAALDEGQAESVWVSEQLGRPVIKAWNNILAESFEKHGLPKGAEGRTALSVAGDDERAKRVVMGLVEETGFDSIDGGSLEDSWRQQPGTPGYCTDYEAEELRESLAAADRSLAPKMRDKGIEEVLAMGDALTHELLVKVNRSLYQ